MSLPKASREECKFRLYNDGIGFPNRVNFRFSNASPSNFLCNFLYILLFLCNLASKVESTDNPFKLSEHSENEVNIILGILGFFSLLIPTSLLLFFSAKKLGRLFGNLNRKQRKEKVQSKSVMFDEQLYPTNNRERIIRELRSGIMMTMYTIPMCKLLDYIGNYMLNISDSDIERLNDNILQSSPLIVCFIRPILEELMDRGVILPGMKLFFKKMGFSKLYAEKASIICNSLLFMIQHPSEYRLGAFAGSLFYCKSTLSNGNSLWQSTAAHISYNSVSLSLISASKYLRR